MGCDKWIIEVEGWINFFRDLFSADALYHKNCYTGFASKLPHTSFKTKQGRPVHNKVMNAFFKLWWN